MPIYEYACSDCNLRFEKIQKISEPNIDVCPKCNGKSVQKLISTTSFRLKGNGWYETDFKSSNETKRNLASSDEPSTSSAKPVTTAEQPAAQTTNTTNTTNTEKTGA